MKTLMLTVFGCVLVWGFINSAAAEDTEVNEKSKNPSDYIVKIIENFRDRMHKGIESIGLPILDPLTIPELKKDIDDGIVKLDLRMGPTNITGLSSFKIPHLKIDIEKRIAKLDIDLPEFGVDGYCYMKGSIMSSFPLKMDGPFSIHSKEIAISGQGGVNASTTEDGAQVGLHDWNFNFTIGSVDFQFNTLKFGNKWTGKLTDVLSGLSKKLFKPLLTLRGSSGDQQQQLENGATNSLLGVIRDAVRKTFSVLQRRLDNGAAAVGPPLPKGPVPLADFET